MPKHDDGSTPIMIRTPNALVARLDAHVERLKARMPGVRFTRSDAIRALLESGLDAEEKREAVRK